MNKTGVFYRTGNMEEEEENLYGDIMNLQMMVHLVIRSLFISLIRTTIAHLLKVKLISKRTMTKVMYLIIALQNI